MLCFIKKNVSFIIFILLTYLIAGIFWTGKMFGKVTFEQLIFNINQPIKGVDVGIIYDMLLWMIGFGSIAAVVLWFPWLLLSSYNIGKYLKKYSCKYHLLVLIAAVALLFSLVCFKLKICDWFLGVMQVGNIYEKNYTIPNELSFNGKKRNLILIIGESLDKRYANEAMFKENLLPHLTDYGQKYDTFNGFEVALGTSWTIAGVTTAFCGTPLKTVMGNEMNIFSEFLPNMVCFPQVLKKYGYNSYYMQGSSLAFSGFSNMLRQHGFDEYLGRDEIVDKYKNLENEVTNWGISDERLFSLAKDKLTEISANGKPFVWGMATIDTHPPSGFLNKSCKKINGDLRDMFRCTDLLIDDFIKWVQKQPFYKDTVVVVVGDHLAMKASIGEPNPDGKSDNGLVNVFINSAVSTQNKSKKFTTLDFSATILEAMNVKLPNHRYGLGVSLYSDAPTLAETYGDDLNSELAKRSELYERFFNQSSLLDADFSVDKYLEYQLGDKYCFYNSKNCRNSLKYVVVGTMLPSEKDVTWTHHRKFEIKLNVGSDVKRDLKLKMKLKAFMTDAKNRRVTEVSVNGHKLGTWTFKKSDEDFFEREIVVPKKYIRSNGNAYIVLDTKGIGSLRKLGISDKDQSLYLGFSEMILEEQ